jgi:hypothetical protein
VQRSVPFARLSACVIVVVHVAANLYWLPARSRTNLVFAPAFARADDSVPRTDDVTRRTVVLVNPPFEPLALYMSFKRDALGQPRPRRVRTLATGASGVAITRVDARTLRVRPDAGFLSSPADTMLRSARHPLSAGSRVALSDVTVEITETTPDARPAEALFHFGLALEDASYTWLAWGAREYVPFPLPAIGATVRLAPADFVHLFAPETTGDGAGKGAGER